MKHMKTYAKYDLTLSVIDPKITPPPPKKKKKIVLFRGF